MKITLDQQARAALISARGQRSLRTIADQVGISHTQLARIETGQRGVDETLLSLLAESLGLEVRIKRKRVMAETVKLIKARV